MAKQCAYAAIARHDPPCTRSGVQCRGEEVGGREQQLRPREARLREVPRDHAGLEQPRLEREPGREAAVAGLVARELLRPLRRARIAERAQVVAHLERARSDAASDRAGASCATASDAAARPTSAAARARASASPRASTYAAARIAALAIDSFKRDSRV